MITNFSVLMSLYNGEKEDNLEECLRSIELQTLLPNEVIIVFDGPVSKNLSNVVEKFKNRLNIEVVKLIKNVGLGQALNMGLRYCNNELIARMDTDDICQPKRFEKQISYMIAHPEITVLGCNITEFDETMTYKIGQRIVPSTHEEIVKFSKLKNPFNHVSVIFRKSVIEKVGGYKHHLYMEDYNLWLRVIADGYKVANLNDCYMDVRGGYNMIKRRKGMTYIKSEYQLAKLKSALHIQNNFSCILSFIVRSIPRLLPLPFLTFFYKKNRST